MMERQQQRLNLSSFDALQGGETLTMTGSGTAASANVANGIAMSSNGNLALADGTEQRLTIA